MIPYVSCEQARDLLEGFFDGELAVDEQVAVEAHLRWCRTCAAHVDDLRLIGASVRGVPGTSVTSDDAYALASVQAGVLARVRAERDQAFRTRVRVSFSDMRLLFPALGATLALVLCFSLTYSVQVTASSQFTELLLARARPRLVDVTQAPYAVAMLEPSADPGSDQNPLRLDDAYASPQLLDRERAMSSLLEGIKDDEAVLTLATIVSRRGRIENYELLRTSADGRHAMAAGSVDSVLSAVRQSRFSPAQAHGGGPVAAYMVWYIEKTTAVAPQPKPVAAKAARPVPPALTTPPTPSDVVPTEPGRSGSLLDSTTTA
jgi:hypothetical protein